MDNATTVDTEAPNKDVHSSLLLKPGFITARVYASPKTDREVASLL